MKKRVVISCLFVPVLLILAVFVLSKTVFNVYDSDPFGIQSRKNRKVMTEYIKENYGEDYKILEKFRTGYAYEYDVFNVSQHGITYRVEAVDGVIINDDYNSEMAGKILGDYLLSIVGKPHFDFDLNCEAFVYESVTAATSFNEITVQSLGVSLILYGVPFNNFDEMIWLYEFYKAVIVVNENLSLWISLYETEKVSGYSNPHLVFMPRKYSDFTMEEFFDQFEYREG